MEVAGVKHPDDEGPNLFGVPAPIAVPGALGPDGSGGEGEGPENQANRVEANLQALEGFLGRKKFEHATSADNELFGQASDARRSAQQVGNR